jgi:hypothetical protein
MMMHLLVAFLAQRWNRAPTVVHKPLLAQALAPIVTKET